MSEREQLEALEKAATPGPWRTGPINYADIYGEDGRLLVLVLKGNPQTVDDAQVIVRLRNAAPRLLEYWAVVERISHWPCDEPAQTSGCECASCLCRAALDTAPVVGIAGDVPQRENWRKLRAAAPRLRAICKVAEELIAISDGHASKTMGPCACALCYHLSGLRAALAGKP